MQTSSQGAIWEGYALTGRPDFLNYLQRGDVTWDDLWSFYRANPADTDAMVRLMGLFHAFLSLDYDRSGSVLDRETGVYPVLREWARLTVELRDLIPEEKLRDSLAGLLGQSLISPLYYEAAFSVYVEAAVERHAQIWLTDPSGIEKLEAPTQVQDRRLSLRLPDLPRFAELQGRPFWEESVSAVVEQHYATWNQAYALVLGDDERDWFDDGGEG